MTSTETLLKQLDNPALSYNEQAQLRCQIAAEYEHRGQYETARDMLADWWQGVGQRPTLEGLTEPIATDVLLRVGTLTGWFGTLQQIERAQEIAKDLIGECINRFEALGENVRVAVAKSELALCYRREGAHDEARVYYTEALKALTDKDKKLKAIILLRLVVVESYSGHYNDALHILTDAATLFQESDNHVLEGKYHNELGCVLTVLSKAEGRPDYTDRAILEYTAAAYHFELAGHTGYHASAESNLGFLLYTIGQYEEAHQHLDCARRLFAGVNNKGRIAQVDEARARVLLAEGRLREAAKVIAEAVRALARGGEQGLLAEALTTQGRVLARLRDASGSQSKLRQAADIAEQAGAVEDAGRALLCLLEEHAERLGEREVVEVYERADGLLKGTQDAETVGRLRACARRIVSARRAAAPTAQSRIRQADFWAGFSLTERVHAYEARYIKRALVEAQGSVSRAARLLGLKHHASLASLLKGRHKGLAHLRTPPEKRTVKVVRLRGPRSTAKAQTSERPRAVKILHVEDNQLIASAVRDALALEGWSVQTVEQGAAALRLLAGSARYDLLIFDHELPGLSGVELVRAARRLAHRKDTPILMLSASDVEAEALAAGADAFLRKPDEAVQLVETVGRLLGVGGRE